MRTGHTFCQLREQWDHHLLELSRLYHIQDLLQLVEKHNLQVKQLLVSEQKVSDLYHFYLLGTVNLGPESEQRTDDWLRQTWIFLKKLNNTVGQLELIFYELVNDGCS